MLTEKLPPLDANLWQLGRAGTNTWPQARPPSTEPETPSPSNSTSTAALRLMFQVSNGGSEGFSAPLGSYLHPSFVLSLCDLVSGAQQ